MAGGPKTQETSNASMEPLFFKAENLNTTRNTNSNAISLQWSRFFSKRKIQLALLVGPAGKGLQWSRFFSKRKISSIARPISVIASASMEPLFFKAENQPRRVSRG